MNFLMYDNLKGALADVHKRMVRIEERRKDYKKSKTWLNLKVKEKMIEEKIKKVEKYSPNCLTMQNK